MKQDASEYYRQQDAGVLFFTATNISHKDNSPCAFPSTRNKTEFKQTLLIPLMDLHAAHWHNVFAKFQAIE